MRVGIVGAGITGLAAARTLSQRGVDTVVFERNAEVGGRCATFCDEGFIWDTGATSLVPRGHAILNCITNALPTDGLTEITKPVYVHSNLRVSPGDTARAAQRFVYADGIAELPRRMAQGLDVRLETPIEALHRTGSGYRIEGEDFDTVILTAPVPQSSLLLWGIGDTRPLATSRYRSCISVLIGLSGPMPDTAYFALIDPEQLHPMTWLSLEHEKAPSRAPALVAQMSRDYSLREFDRPDEGIIATVTAYLHRLYPDLPDIAAAHVIRWRYSQPESLGDFDLANPPGERLIIASDGLIGGRMEDAYDAGVRAAERV